PRSGGTAHAPERLEHESAHALGVRLEVLADEPARDREREGGHRRLRLREERRPRVLDLEVRGGELGARDLPRLEREALMPGLEGARHLLARRPLTSADHARHRPSSATVPNATVLSATVLSA